MAPTSGAPSVLRDRRLPSVHAEGQMHDRQRAADLTLGEHEAVLKAVQARLDRTGQDASAPPDCGASLRHDKVVDGSDALPDENAQARKLR